MDRHRFMVRGEFWIANGETMYLRWRFLLFVLVGFGSCAAPVRVEDVEGKIVSKVTIRHEGAKSVQEARLRTHIGTTAGSRYETERSDNDIKALYESGLVNDVRVVVRPRRGGVEVIYEVQARGMIGPGPEFTGNTVFADELLAKEGGLRAGQTMDTTALRAVSRRVEAYYHAKGYPGTKVTPRSQTAEGGSVDFIFIVEEGPSSNR